MISKTLNRNGIQALRDLVTRRSFISVNHFLNFTYTRLAGAFSRMTFNFHLSLGMISDLSHIQMSYRQPEDF